MLGLIEDKLDFAAKDTVPGRGVRKHWRLCKKKSFLSRLYVKLCGYSSFCVTLKGAQTSAYKTSLNTNNVGLLHNMFANKQLSFLVIQIFVVLLLMHVKAT